MKVFRKFCLECVGGSSLIVKECEKEDCPMHRYRMGKNPARTGIGNASPTPLEKGKSKPESDFFAWIAKTL